MTFSQNLNFIVFSWAEPSEIKYELEKFLLKQANIQIILKGLFGVLKFSQKNKQTNSS